MTSTPQLTLALIMTNAGGEGKSTWAEILAAFGRLAGHHVVVADVDPGNRGYLNRNGDESALRLDWAPRADGDVNAPADPEAWFNQHLAGRKLAILDTGANMLAAANPINQFVGGLIEAAKRKGARIIIYGVTSPNKAGSDELIEAMYERFHRAAEIVVVQNDRDGSKEFRTSLAALGTPIVNLPHIEPGLQALRLRRCIPLDEVLAQPEPGYEHATALIAKRLLAAAKQEAVVDIIGNGAATSLDTLALAAPTTTYYRISTLALTRNATILANAELGKTWQQFRQVDRSDDSALLERARALHVAADRYVAHC